MKAAVIRALEDAIKHAGLPCIAYTDGMTVAIDEEHAREPDAAVECGVAFNPNTPVLEAPLIVVEVASPSSEPDDTVIKLAEYFSVPSIRHYLIVNPVEKLVIHHARTEGGEVAKSIVRTGEIELVPPGMKLPVDALLPAIG